MSPCGPKLICAALLLAIASPLFAATPEEVDKAINRGVAWLYSQQNEQFNWESSPGPDRDARTTGPTSASATPANGSTKPP
jgi:hypothetical protein